MAACMPFDAAQFLDNEDMICAYLNEGLQENNPDFLLLAFGDIARARGMSQMARQTLALVPFWDYSRS